MKPGKRRLLDKDGPEEVAVKRKASVFRDNQDENASHPD